ncbi:polysaccharide pyruvyl transferase family protein [Gaoshiqia sp. Z1-71]|uniref:polysaccharide pyruvyl transferase family protein n=1 Tax=Gaoshiqia hydrogeniformans TaxID=3290090 RepID=UPI003BF80BC7
MKSKILIIDAYTDSNIGSCALVENSIWLLERMFPEAEIKLMAHYPDAFRERYGVEVVQDVFKYPFLRNRFYQLWWVICTLNWMLFVYVLPVRMSRLFFNKRINDYLWADLVISIGAERINDKYIQTAFFSEYTYKLIKKFKKKIVLFPSTIGPFIYTGTKAVFKFVAKDIDLIYTRDIESYNITKQLTEGFNTKLINTCDVAVFQKWEDRKDRLIRKFGKPIVGISVMKWIYVANKYETPYSNYESYVREMVRLIDTLVQQYDVHITLFPTNYPVHGGQGDDLSVALDIYDKIDVKENVDIVDQLLSPYEFKSLLSASEINITTRMHACILSTGAFVPTISVNYLFKLREYMSSIGLSDYSLDIEDFEYSMMLEMFDKMWNHRDYWHTHLENEIANNRQNLLSALELLNSLS